MNEHNIDNFMKLATNGEGRSDRGSDHYYRDVYEEIMSGKKTCWNWSAAFFGLSWVLYRKMFAMYFLCQISAWLGVSLITLLTLKILSTIPSPITSQENAGLIGVAIATILEFLVFGLYGNWLYVRHIHKKIDQGYHLCSLKNTSVLSAFLSIFAIPFIYFSDKRKVKAALAERALVAESIT